MPRTEKTKVGTVTHWLDYDVTSTDSVEGKLVVQVRRDDGITVTLESEAKRSYGRNSYHALEGLGKRFAKSLDRMITLITEAQGVSHG